MEQLTLYNGSVLNVHERGECLGEHCCIHNPSQHPLRAAPYAWWDLGLLVRVCSHGQQHPDPDSIQFALLKGAFMMIEAVSSVHLDHCDGCCH